MSKEQGIDIIFLYAKSNHLMWNSWLTEKVALRDINGLNTMRRRLQIGMRDVAKKKLNTEKIDLFFLRLQTSIEKTIRQVYRMKNPHPCDNPMIAKNHIDKIESKRKRDQQLTAILKKTSY